MTSARPGRADGRSDNFSARSEGCLYGTLPQARTHWYRPPRPSFPTVQAHTARFASEAPPGLIVVPGGTGVPDPATLLWGCMSIKVGGNRGRIEPGLIQIGRGQSQSDDHYNDRQSFSAAVNRVHLVSQRGLPRNLAFCARTQTDDILFAMRCKCASVYCQGQRHNSERSPNRYNKREIHIGLLDATANTVPEMHSGGQKPTSVLSMS